MKRKKERLMVMVGEKREERVRCGRGRREEGRKRERRDVKEGVDGMKKKVKMKKEMGVGRKWGERKGREKREVKKERGKRRKRRRVRRGLVGRGGG